MSRAAKFGCPSTLRKCSGTSRANSRAIDKSFSTCLHPEDAARLREAMERSIRDDALVDMEVRARTRSGEQRWYRVRGALERNSSGTALTVSGSQRDITQRQQYAVGASRGYRNRSRSQQRQEPVPGEHEP